MFLTEGVDLLSIHGIKVVVMLRSVATSTGN